MPAEALTRKRIVAAAQQGVRTHVLNGLMMS
jgi:hypothetical protein